MNQTIVNADNFTYLQLAVVVIITISIFGVLIYQIKKFNKTLSK